MSSVISEAMDYIRGLFQGNSDGHGFDHSIRVYRNAIRISETEPESDRQIVALAALLHDADDDKLFATENNANARSFLNTQALSPETVDRICEAINAVSFRKNRGKKPETPEGQIVQDADRLDAIGAVGIARTFAFGGAHGRPLAASIEHFHEKLLLLKDELNTKSARAIAESRHAFMESFLAEWERETDGERELKEAPAVRNEADLNRSIRRMTDQIAGILEDSIHSIWLYGSVVLDDFRPGWSDIDLLVLSSHQITEHQARQLVSLRQTMLEKEPENPYYRSFEGIIADRDEYFTGSFSRLVYWGTSGQRITDRYQQDVFSAFELAKYGRSVYGSDDRSIFAEPAAAELRAAVKQHYESIRRYAVQTDEQLYSCGWLLDIARCIYTLRYGDVTAKTRAGFWALSEHIFENEEPLKKTLEIRQHPMMYMDREDVKQWLRELGPAVQQYADVLERELQRGE